MALSLNKVSLIGHVGKPPEIRKMQSGKEVAIFQIATDYQWQDKSTGTKKKKTEWHRVVVFQEGLARIVKAYVSSGSRLYIEGSLQTRKWVNARNFEQSITEVVLQGYDSELILLDTKKQDSPSQETHDVEVYPLAPQIGKEVGEAMRNQAEGVNLSN